MNLSAPFILRPVMTTFVMLALIIAGWMAYKHLPVSDVPSIELPTIHVSASYTGASPDSMLHLVTMPLEKELTHVKGLQEMTSSTSTGATEMTLTFELGKDMNIAVRDVQDALNKAEYALPNDMDGRPTYSREAGGQEPIMYILLASASVDMADLRAYTEAYILPRLSRIEGLAQVSVMGSSHSLWLQVNPEWMAARHISFDQLVDTVKRLTTEIPLGTIQTSNRLLSLELVGQVKKAAEIENAYISGTSLPLGAIAKLSSGPSDRQDFYFGTPTERSKTLILAVQKTSDGNTVAVSTAVKKELDSLQKHLPSSIKLNVWFDKAVWINESIVDVQYALVFALILVVVVIYLSLGRFSEALISSAALPLSLLGTCMAMYLLDFSLDLLSLLALTLSVGFVVDDAIVVLENIVRKQEEGLSPLEASLQGSRQIGFTILSMTVSLVAVFMPLLFMPGVNGRLFRAFSVTLAVSILVSGLISLSLTPMLCRRFLKHNPSESSLQRAINNMHSRCVAFYSRSLRVCFTYSKTVLSAALLCVVACVPLFSKLAVDLLPPEDRGFLFVFVVLPAGSSKEQIGAYQETIHKVIQQQPHIDNFLEFTLGTNLGFAVRLLPLAQREPQAQVIDNFETALNEIAGIQAFVNGYQLINLDFDLGNGGQYKYQIQGAEFVEVEAAAEQLVKALQNDEMIASAYGSQKNDAPKLAITFNADYAHRLGIQKYQVQELLQYAYGQGAVGKIQNGTTNQSIFLELADGYNDQVSSLSKLFLRAANGSLVPLRALITWQEVMGAPRLNRKDQLPTTTVRFSLKPHIAAQQGIQQVESIAEKHLPEGLIGSMTGAAKAVTAAMSETVFLLLAAAMVMYIVLGILYESFIHPLTILSSLPLASLGGILTLLIFDEPLSIFSAVGFLLLIGIVKKNGIMMIDYALEAQKAGKSPQEAIYQGCLVRFRPIMMTTVAAIMGALPIAIGFGDGAEMRRGLGLVIVGGLLFSQVLTLFVTPLLFLQFERGSAWFKRWQLKGLRDRAQAVRSI